MLAAMSSVDEQSQSQRMRYNHTMKCTINDKCFTGLQEIGEAENNEATLNSQHKLAT